MIRLLSYNMWHIVLLSLISLSLVIANEKVSEVINQEQESEQLYKIEGRVVRPDSSVVSEQDWFGNTRVFTNDGHIGFLRLVNLIMYKKRLEIVDI